MINLLVNTKIISNYLVSRYVNAVLEPRFKWFLRILGLFMSSKIAVVTGAARGIGYAVMRRLCRDGAVVAALDSDAETLQASVAELNQAGLRAVAFPVDIRDSDAVDATIARIERELGPIDLLANVAGILRLAEVVSLSNEDWLDTFAVNVHGVFYVSRAVARCMKARKRGAIVTVASNAASTPRTQMGAYGASKAALVMFTKCLGLELAHDRIRCNIVSPGSTDTAMQRMLWQDEESGAKVAILGTPEAYRVGIPLQKLAQADDVAAAVAFLLSDQAGHITMHNLCVDGGATLGVT